MKQAWNELFYSQANNPLSFQFFVFKSSDIHPNRGRQLVRYGSQNSKNLLFLSAQDYGMIPELPRWHQEFRECASKPALFFMKSSVDSVFVIEQDVPEAQKGLVFTWTVGQPSSSGTVAAGTTFVSALCPDCGGWRHPRGCFLTSTPVSWSVSELPALPHRQLGT